MASILGVLIFFFSYSGLKVTTVTIVSNSDIATEFITNTTDDYLGSQRFLFFKNDNYLLLHEDQLELAISNGLSNAVSLETLIVDKDLPNSLTIKAAVRTPSILYSSNKSQYLLDENGIVALRYAPPTDETSVEASDDTKQFPQLVDNNNRLTTIGETVTSKEFIEALQLLVREAPPREIDFKQFEIPEIFCPLPEAVLEPLEEGTDESTSSDPATNENINGVTANTNLRVNTNINVEEPACVRQDLILNNAQLSAKLAAGPLVHFTLRNDLVQQLEALEVFLSDKGGEISLLSYIDVRFPDHVYYQ